MGERALRAGLLLLSLALSLGPLVVALASEGWDLRSAFLGEMGPLEDLTSEGKGPKINAGDPQFLGPITRENLPGLVIPITLTNSYSFKLWLKEISMEVLCLEDRVRVGSGALESPVVVGPESSRELRLTITFTPEGSSHLLERHLKGFYLHASLKLDVSFTLDIYGLEIRVPVEETLEIYQEVEG